MRCTQSGLASASQCLDLSFRLGDRSRYPALNMQDTVNCPFCRRVFFHENLPSWNCPQCNEHFDASSQGKSLRYTTQFASGDMLWLMTGVCFLLSICGFYLADAFDYVWYIGDTASFWGCTCLILALSTLLILTPIIYFTKNWYFRTILLGQWLISTAVLVWQFLAGLWFMLTWT